jgi:hypothetical protein
MNFTFICTPPVYLRPLDRISGEQVLWMWAVSRNNEFLHFHVSCSQPMARLRF